MESGAELYPRKADKNPYLWLKFTLLPSLIRSLDPPHPPTPHSGPSTPALLLLLFIWLRDYYSLCNGCVFSSYPRTIGSQRLRPPRSVNSAGSLRGFFLFFLFRWLSDASLRWEEWVGGFESKKGSGNDVHFWPLRETLHWPIKKWKFAPLQTSDNHFEWAPQRWPFSTFPGWERLSVGWGQLAWWELGDCDPNGGEV